MKTLVRSVLLSSLLFTFNVFAGVTSDDFNDGIINPGWASFQNGCALTETGGEFRIQGTTVISGWGHGNGLNTHFTHLGTSDDFEVSVDFSIPQFSGPGTRLVYLMGYSSTGKTFGMFYSYGYGYRVQTWEPRQFSTWLRPFGDESSAFHKMKLVYSSESHTLTGFVDDHRVGSVNIHLQGNTSLNINTSSETAGMVIDARFDNFLAVKNPSQGPVSSVSITDASDQQFHDVMIDWSGAPSGTSLEDIEIGGHSVVDYAQYISPTKAYIPGISFLHSTSLPAKVKLRTPSKVVEEEHVLSVVSDWKGYTDWVTEVPWEYMLTALELELPVSVSEALPYLDAVSFLWDVYDKANAEDTVGLVDILFAEGLNGMAGPGSSFVIDKFTEFMILKPFQGAFTDEDYALLMSQGTLGRISTQYGIAVKGLFDWLSEGWDPFTGDFNPPSAKAPPVIGAPLRNADFSLLELSEGINSIGPAISTFFSDLFDVSLFSPVTVEITDPFGRVFSSEASEIPFSFFITVADTNTGHEVERYFVYNPVDGPYHISAAPKASATLSGVYTIITSLYGSPVVLANNTAVSDIPTQGYLSEVDTMARPTEVIWEMLPPSKKYKAGRTIPIKFSLNVAGAVDPLMPWIYDENLEVWVFDDKMNAIQSYMYGESSQNYRIDLDEGIYVANFKTPSIPGFYTVEIWRNGILYLGKIEFQTE